MEILIQLKEELGRLYIAGSKNALNDPRIKKYVEPLEKLSEKSKVFEALKVGVQGLVEGTEAESFVNLSKVYALVNSVLTTQSEFSNTSTYVEELKEYEKIYENVLSYKELPKFLENYDALRYGNYKDNEIKSLVKVLNTDARLYKYINKKLERETRIFQLKKLFDEIDSSLALYFLYIYEPKNTIVCMEKLKYIHSKLGDNEEVFNEKVVPLAKLVIDKKYATVTPTAIRVLGHNIENEEIVLNLSKKKKDDALESCLVALYQMGSEQFTSMFTKQAEENLLFATGVLKEMLVITKDLKEFEKYVDIVFDKYIHILDNEELNYQRFDITSNAETTIDVAAQFLSVLSYEKYNTFFDKLLDFKFLFDDHLNNNNFDFSIINLISNDKKYNQMIFDKLTKYMETNKKTMTTLDMFCRSNSTIHYYLIVIKNLFDKEKVYELTMDYIKFCEDVNMLTTPYIEEKYSYLIYMVLKLSKEVPVSMANPVEVYKNNLDLNMDTHLKNIDERVFNYLFNDTYLFQNTLGTSRYLSNDINYTVTLLSEYFSENPEASKLFLEKLKDFIFNKIEIFKDSKIVKFLEKYHILNLTWFDNEDYFQLFFEVMEFDLTHKVPEKQGFTWGISTKYYDMTYAFSRNEHNRNYLKYKYLLNEEKYKTIREYLENNI